ncbi:MAG TPA: c-type cytochrome, partial [Longimicrobiales bacterium]|nr:c-type cytochrome [Longimicrobiales bacterium]
LPFMEFHEMSDEDLIAVISFLRSQTPVKHAVPDHEVNFMGKVLLSYLIKPVGPAGEPPATSPPEGPTIERGAYLANNVAACVGCHTKRSMKDGSYIGPKFAGGGRFTLETPPGTVLVTPNLTPDPATGHLTWWSEQQFLDRFRAGSKIAGSHMPWAAYSRMSDDDIRAIYRFLRALPPVNQDNGPMVQTEE